MTDCSTIREALLRGAAKPPRALEEHLASCPQCRELFAENAEVGRSLAFEATLSAPFPEALFEPLSGRLQRETGLRAWLRSRPSRQRLLAVLVSVLAAVAVGGALRLRADFSAYPGVRLLAIVGIYSSLIGIACGKELFSSVHRDARRDYVGLFLGALALPFLLTVLPATDASRGFASAGALGCFSYGALLTFPTAALLYAFDRNDRLSLRTVCLSAAALGLSANLVLELHCPNGNPLHLLLGHASLGLAWLLAWAVFRRLA